MGGEPPLHRSPHPAADARGCHGLGTHDCGGLCGDCRGATAATAATGSATAAAPPPPAAPTAALAFFSRDLSSTESFFHEGSLPVLPQIGAPTPIYCMFLSFS